MRAIPLVLLIGAVSCHRSRGASAPAVGADRLRMIPQLGHDAFEVAVTDDGRYVASTSGDSTKLWSVETGMLIRTWPEGGVTVAIAPDASAIWRTLNVSDVAALWRLDVLTGERVRVGDPTLAYTAVVTSPDGRTVATTASRDHQGYVLVLDAETLDVRWQAELGMPADYEGNAGVAYAADGGIVTADALGEVVWWDEGGHARWRSHVERDPSSSPTKVAVAGKRVAVCADHHVLVILDAADGSEHARGREDQGCYGLARAGPGKFVAASYTTVEVIEAATGDVAYVSKGTSFGLDASADGQVIVTTEGGAVQLRSARVAVVRELVPNLPNVETACMSDDARVLVVGRGRRVEVWDLAAARLQAQWTQETYTTNPAACAVSPDGTTALVPMPDGVGVMDLASGLTIRIDDTPAPDVLRWAPDSKRVVVLADELLRVVDAGTGETLLEQRIPATTSPCDADLCATMNLDPRLGFDDAFTTIAFTYLDRIWLVDVATGAVTGSDQGTMSVRADGTLIVERGRAVEGASPFHDDGDTAVLRDGTLASVDVYGVLALGDRFLDTRMSLPAFAGESRDGRFLLLVDEGGPRLIERATGHMYAMSAVGDEWVLYTEDGYFEASRGGGALLGVGWEAPSSLERALMVYRIDQLAARNNRPDLILERLGLGDADAIAYYRARRQQRLDGLGLADATLDASLEAAPTVEIAGVEVRGAIATVRVTVREPSRGVQTIQAFVDGVPVVTEQVEGTEVTRTLQVPLATGDNRIEVGARGLSGVEALRPSQVVHLDGAAAGNLYFIGFGVSDYADDELDLAYAAKDITDLGDALGAAEGFRKVHVHTFVDAAATPAAIRDARRLLDGAGPDDTVIVAAAGHGMHDDDAAAGYYFLTHDADPARLSATAASFDTIEALFEGVGARRRLLLLDTCESGELDPAVVASYDDRAAQQALTSRGIARRTKATAAPRPFLLDRDRYALVDLAHLTGAVVLSSSRGHELSYESAEASNGLFTQALLDALGGADADGDGEISIPELRDAVAAQVARTTDGLQHPVIDRANPSARIVLPPVAGAAAIADR